MTEYQKGDKVRVAYDATVEFTEPNGRLRLSHNLTSVGRTNYSADLALHAVKLVERPAPPIKVGDVRLGYDLRNMPLGTVARSVNALRLVALTMSGWISSVDGKPAVVDASEYRVEYIPE